MVDIIYRDSKETIQHKYVFWHHEPNEDALEDWILDYYDQISEGYLPEGFTKAPRPFAARIYKRGNLLAEWIKPESTSSNLIQFPSPAPSAESHVTAKIRAGRGGIPAATPSTTTPTSGSRKVISPNSPSSAFDTTDKSTVNDVEDLQKLSGAQGQSVA